MADVLAASGAVYLGTRPSPQGSPLDCSAVNGTLWRPSSAAELRTTVSVPVVARRLRLPEGPVAAVAEHWVSLRRRRHFRPLLPGLRGFTARERARASDPTPRQRWRATLRLREKLERLRTLADMVARREKLKREVLVSLWEETLATVHARLAGATTSGETTSGETTSGETGD